MIYSSHASSARKFRCAALAGTIALLGIGLQSALPAHAQFVSIVSGNGSTNNLTIDTNGTIVATNTAVVSFSNTGINAGYDLTNHVLGTTSTPTFGGFSSTPTVSEDGGAVSYSGGPATIVAPDNVTLTSEDISAFDGSTYGGDIGYYKYTVNFTVASASGQPFIITGFANADNEIQDVILDYGTTVVGGTTTQTGTVLGMTALNGTEIRNTNNQASNISFQTSTSASNLGAAHTLSFIVYNNDGPTNVNFGFTATTMPEPAALGLLGAGLPLVGAFVVRRKKLSS